MNKLIFLFCLVISPLTRAQVDTMQDRPEIHWSQIENQDFKVVFPTHMEGQAQYILNLLNFYKEPVSATYDVDTKKFPLIIRSELAGPNGFVALMPRRSEWFSHSAITPLVSSLEWHQSLAIHEYRHMVQYDFFKRPYTNVGYFLFGEMGLALLMAASAPVWFFEGDAVWAETVLSNAGRGRSPRFSARMKSLVINDQLPSYDQLIGGVYDTILPNHYVFGYFLITRAYNIYGEKVWKEVIEQAAKRPYNLYTFYNAFEFVTGHDFMWFYEETLRELRQDWKASGQKAGNRLYTAYEYPMLDNGTLYYLKFDLDNFWGLYGRKNGIERKVRDLNISPSLSRVDLKRGKFVYSQMLPDNRYGYKSYSDLYLLDVATGKQTRVTKGRRLYNPQIHPQKDQVMAVEFKENNQFALSFFDFEGKKLKEFFLKDMTVAEAVWFDSQSVLAIILDQQGMKQIVRLNLDGQKFEILKKAGRNNIFGLQVFEGKAFFEADDQGIVNIFSLDLNTLELARHGNEKIAAYRPFPAQDKIYYVAEVENGQQIKSMPKSGAPAPKDFLGDFSKYLGEGPSSNFHKSSPKTVEDFSKLREKSAVREDYFELERGFTPHSWSFIGGRGYQLEAITQNYLNTFSAVATVGEDAEEQRPFANLFFNYRKYYPIFSLGFSYSERNTELDEWSEASAGVGMTLPYIYQKNLYGGYNALSFFGESVHVSNRERALVHELDDEQLLINRVVFNSSLLKKRRYRELQPNWGYNLQAQYAGAEAQEDSSFSSYLGHANLNLYAPGIQTNHGTRLSFSGEYRPEAADVYRIDSPAGEINEYAFSRGYQYEYVEAWQKASLNYILPISYPNRSFGRWVYFNRIYTNFFFDHTKVTDDDEGEFSLNSYGAELFFQSLTFRKIPLTYGLRLINKLSREEDSMGEFFVNVDVGF